MLAFASNSILCRLALKEAHIDPLTFTLLRLASGALILSTLVWCRSSPIQTGGSWPGAVASFLYAMTFSLASVGMEAGAGPLFLFGAVHRTMMLYGVAKGARLTALPIVGLLICLAV